jgi:hypothetical protein
MSDKSKPIGSEGSTPEPQLKPGLGQVLGVAGGLPALAPELVPTPVELVTPRPGTATAVPSNVY